MRGWPGPLDPFDEVFEGANAGKAGSLEGGKGLGDERVKAESEIRQVGMAGGGFGNGMLQVFG